MPQLEHSSRGETKGFSGGPKNCLNKHAPMKGIFHRVLRRSPEKKKNQSTNEILLPVIGGKKKLCNVINFAFYWTVLGLKGTLNASMMGSLEGENFCSGSAAPPVLTILSTMLQYVSIVLRFRQILKLFRMFLLS